VSDEATGVATLYDGPGTKQSLVVTIPKNNPKDPTFLTGAPTGVIANGSTTDFPVAPGKPAAFIFATLDGSIAGWNPTVALAQGANPPSTNAVTVVHTTDGSGYTALTTALVDGNRYLYAANFLKGRIDVYDNTFTPIKLKGEDQGRDDRDFDFDFGGEKPFTDDRLPRNFVPFNVQAIGNDLVVTYALHIAGNPFETPGPGLGYVDIYSAKGKLLRRLEHGDWLNAPWGVTLAPLDFGQPPPAGLELRSGRDDAVCGIHLCVRSRHRQVCWAARRRKWEADLDQRHLEHEFCECGDREQLRSR